MPLEEKCMHYKCGKRYRTLENVPTLADDGEREGLYMYPYSHILLFSYPCLCSLYYDMQCVTGLSFQKERLKGKGRFEMRKNIHYFF